MVIFFNCTPNLIKSLVVDDFLETFDNFGVTAQDIFITHEFKNEVSRNNYLHFDRLRSFKVLLYLTDVDQNNGPFCLVEKSHFQGAKFRRGFAAYTNYEEKKNRIDLDYPNLKYNLLPIIGKPGTTIVFDSDIFHSGGAVNENSERLILRSHWYKDFNWRLNS